MRHFRRSISLMAWLPLLAGCGALPAAGPTAEAIEADAQTAREGSTDFLLLDLAPETAAVANKAVDPGPMGRFRGAAVSPELRLGPGDVVQITVYESVPDGGLFSRGGGTVQIGGGNYIVLANQAIDRAGNISVPYGGIVHAAGLREVDLKREIERRLESRAVEPQALVTVMERHSNLVTVVGDVRNPGRVPVDNGGLRVLDAIAAAGGAAFPPYLTQVTVQRGRTQVTAQLSAVFADPSQDVFLAPGDTVKVTHPQRFYIVLGASGSSGRIEIDTPRVSLGEAIARGGGLLDDRADPTGVFLYRVQRRSTLDGVGSSLPPRAGEDVPVIYRLNLRDPGALFVADEVEIRDRDIIYVSTAPSVDFLKAIAVMRGATAPLRDVTGGASEVLLISRGMGVVGSAAR